MDKSTDKRNRNKTQNDKGREKRSTKLLHAMSICKVAVVKETKYEVMNGNSSSSRLAELLTIQSRK